MPNWCANRLRVTGPESEVSKVRALMEGSADAPGYVRAAGEGIQLFLAGCAGLLRPTAATEYAPCPALNVTAGSDTPDTGTQKPASVWPISISRVWRCMTCSVNSSRVQTPMR
ncbi:hypothetical protein ACVLVH_004543 [Kluyvera sp. 1366]